MKSTRRQELRGKKTHILTAASPPFTTRTLIKPENTALRQQKLPSTAASQQHILSHSRPIPPPPRRQHQHIPSHSIRQHKSMLHSSILHNRILRISTETQRREQLARQYKMCFKTSTETMANWKCGGKERIYVRSGRKERDLHEPICQRGDTRSGRVCILLIFNTN